MIHNIPPQQQESSNPHSNRRPLSECYLGNREITQQQVYHERGIPEEIGEVPQEDEEDEVYEIDCGRSNVEVRCIRERAPSRAMTTRSALPGNQGMARWGQERQMAADPFAMRYVTLKDVDGYHQRDLQTPQPHHYGYNHQLLGNPQQGFNPYGTWSRQPSFRNYPANTVQVPIEHRRNRAASQLAPQNYLGPQMQGYFGNQHLRPASPHQQQEHPTRGMTSSLSLQFRSNPQLSPSKQQTVTSLMNKSKSGDDLLSGEIPNQKDLEKSSEGSSEERKNLSKNSGELRLF